MQVGAAAEAEVGVDRNTLLQAWRRTSIGKAGQMRWVPQQTVAQQEEWTTESDTEVSALDSTKLSCVSNLLEQAHRTCPLVPIHTSHCDGAKHQCNELVLLRRAGVQHTHQEAAALALQMNYAARTALQHLCGEINPNDACARNWQTAPVHILFTRIQEQAAALEALQCKCGPTWLLWAESA
jgi:hypothetical protein